MNSTATDTPATTDTDRTDMPTTSRYSHTRCSPAEFADRAGSTQFIIENVLCDAFGTSFTRSEWGMVGVEPTDTAPAGQLLFTHPDYNTYDGVIISSTHADGESDVEFDVLKTSAEGTELYEIGLDLQTALMKAGQAAQVNLKRTSDTPPNTSGKIRLIADILDCSVEYEFGTLGTFTARLPVKQRTLHSELTSHIDATELKTCDSENIANNTPWSITVLSPEKTGKLPQLIIDHDDYTYNTTVIITPTATTDNTQYRISDTYAGEHTTRDTVTNIEHAVHRAMTHATTLQQQCAPRPKIESLIIFENACRT